jgi:hypothetical protein
MKYAEYFDSIAFRVELLRKTHQEYERTLSTKFNLLQYVNFGENRMSDILADLLSPVGNHGQTDLYLRLFIELIQGKQGVNENCKNLLSSRLGQPSVNREVATYLIEADKRRIDVVISWANYAIGIENKPWTEDQPEQLNAYSQYLSKKYSNNYLLIYLSEGAPSENSIPKIRKEELEKEGRYIQLTYSNDLDIWLNTCINESQSEKMRYFLKDFNNRLKQEFAQMTTENTNEIVKYSLESERNLSAVIETQRAYNSVLYGVSEKFHNTLVLKLEEKFKSTATVRGESEAEHKRKLLARHIEFRCNSWPEGTHCALVDDNEDPIYLSVRSEEYGRELYDFIKQHVTDKLSVVYDNHWWTKNVKYTNWPNSTTETIEIYNGTAVDYFMNEFMKLVELIDKFIEERN